MNLQIISIPTTKGVVGVGYFQLSSGFPPPRGENTFTLQRYSTTIEAQHFSQHLPPDSSLQILRRHHYCPRNFTEITTSRSDAFLPPTTQQMKHLTMFLMLSALAHTIEANKPKEYKGCQGKCQTVGEQKCEGPFFPHSHLYYLSHS
jgi:hypothetical protein